MSRNIAHLMNRGMLRAAELCITLHNYNTHWEDKITKDTIIFSLRERILAPNSK